MDFSQYPVTLLLIAVNAILSITAFSNHELMGKLIGWPYYERKGQVYRMITSGFVHADWMHLFFNMFTLFFFGSFLEGTILKDTGLGGTVSYLILYFAGLLASSLPSFFKHKDDYNYRSLGASGAVSALVFSTIVFSPWTKIELYGVVGISALVYAVLYIIYCVYAGKQQAGNINHDAHLWGSIFGLVYAVALIALLRPDVFPYIMEELKNPSIIGRKYFGPVVEYLLTK